MERTIFCIMLAVLVIGFTGSEVLAQKVDSEGRQLIEAPFTSVPPAIDGVMSAGEWKNAASNTVDFVKLGIAGNSGPGITDSLDDISYTFSVMYDNTYLYIAIAVKDDIYVGKNYGRRLQWDLPVTWENDGVEYFFDGDISRTLETCRTEAETATGGQFIFGLGAEDSPLPFVAAEIYGKHTRLFGPAATDDYYYQTKVDAGVSDWVQEARFKLSIIGAPISANGIGFNISVDDVDTVDDLSMETDHYLEVRDIQLYWTVFGYSTGDVVTENTHETENLWGTLRFLKAVDVQNWSLF